MGCSSVCKARCERSMISPCASQKQKNPGNFPRAVTLDSVCDVSPGSAAGGGNEGNGGTSGAGSSQPNRGNRHVPGIRHSLIVAKTTVGENRLLSNPSRR